MRLLTEEFINNSEFETDPNRVEKAKIKLTANLSKAIEPKINWAVEPIGNGTNKYVATIIAVSEVDWKLAKQILISLISKYPEAEEDIRRACGLIVPMDGVF